MTLIWTCVGFSIAFLLSIPFLFPERKKGTQPLMHATQYELEGCVISFNNSIEEFNSLSRTYGTKVNDLMDQAQKAHDLDSMEALVSRIHEQEQIIDEIARNISRTKILFDDPHADLEVIQMNIKTIRSLLADTKDNYHQLDYIEIKEQQRVAPSAPANPKPTYFDGCKTKEEVTKRYRLLSKAYHPDSGCGDAQLFSELTKQYENALRSF